MSLANGTASMVIDSREVKVRSTRNSYPEPPSKRHCCALGSAAFFLIAGAGIGIGAAYQTQLGCSAEPPLSEFSVAFPTSELTRTPLLTKSTGVRERYNVTFASGASGVVTLVAGSSLTLTTVLAPSTVGELRMASGAGTGVAVQTKVRDPSTGLHAILTPHAATLRDIESIRGSGFRYFHVACEVDEAAAAWSATLVRVQADGTLGLAEASPALSACVDLLVAASAAYLAEDADEAANSSSVAAAPASRALRRRRLDVWDDLVGGLSDASSSGSSVSNMAMGEADTAASASGATAAGSDTASYIQHNEGMRLTAYVDTAGIPTIGVGANLETEANQKFLESRGYSIAKLKDGSQSLSNADAEGLFHRDLQTASANAVAYVGGEGTWDGLSPSQKKALTDMSFQLGSYRLGQFKEMQAAIQAGNWDEAATQMGDSDYCKQVPSRCGSNQALLRKGGGSSW